MPSSQAQSPNLCSAWVQTDSETRSAIGQESRQTAFDILKTVKAQFFHLPSCLRNHNSKQLETQLMTWSFQGLWSHRTNKNKREQRATRIRSRGSVVHVSLLNDQRSVETDHGMNFPSFPSDVKPVQPRLLG